MRVLVVDDEVRNAELTALELRDAGHETEFVNGGEAALARLAAAPFDAVVTDLRMTPPDGLALLREVRAALARDDGRADDRLRQRSRRRAGAASSGAYDYVDKEGEFRDELARILERGRARARRCADDEPAAGRRRWTR